MINYVLLYKDEAEKRSYFYHLEEQAVYLDKETADSAVLRRMSRSGALAALFLYPTIRSAQNWNVKAPEVLCIQIAILGLLLGGIFSVIIINYAGRIFAPENKLELTEEEVRGLFAAGKGYRRKCCFLLIGLFVFLVIGTYVLCNLNMNTYLFWCFVFLWGILVSVFWTNRPICSYRFRRSLVKKEKILRK